MDLTKWALTNFPFSDIFMITYEQLYTSAAAATTYKRPEASRVIAHCLNLEYTKASGKPRGLFYCL